MNSCIKIILLLAALLSITTVIAAEENETISLDQLISELLKNNPEIQAAESRYRSVQARPAQVRTLPDPVVSFITRNGSGNPVPFTELGSDPVSSVGLMWEQELPFPGKLRLAGDMAQKEADAAKADIDAVKWKAVTALKEAYFDYFQTDKSIRILNESRGLLKRFEEIARARYSVGQGIQQDVLRSQVEISILDQRLTTMHQERESAVAEINRLLNRPVNAPLPDPAELKPTPFLFPMETLESDFLMQAPQIRSAEAMVSREKAGLELAKKQYRPDFMTSLEYANSPNFPDMWEIQIGLRIPLFYKKKQANGVVEAEHNVLRAQKELQTIKQELAFLIKNQYLQIQASEKLLKLYEQAVLPQTNLALESSLASYQVGKSDFLTTLMNFMTLLEYRVNYYEELAKHETAITRLERTLGRSVAMKEGKGETNNG